MADSVRKVDYFYVMLGNAPGEGARVLDGLANAGVNLLAFSGFPSGRKAQLDLVPEDPAALKRAAKALGLTLSPRKSGFLVSGDDRVGALTGILGRLRDAGISIKAMDAVSCGEKRFGAIFWVEPRDVAKAQRALKS
jgi:hypothetical protein